MNRKQSFFIPLLILLLHCSYLYAWHYPEWRYRTPVAIVNDGRVILTNQQALLIVDSESLIGAGCLRTDGADIRITSPADTTPIPFWLEPNTLNSQNTRIWITPSTLSTAGTETIWLYTGMPSASSQSSPTGVFQQIINSDFPLLAAWPLDEDTGYTAYDTSGNGNHGTILNALWTTGRTPTVTALFFNGSNALVGVPHSETLAPTSAFSVETWIKPAAEYPGWLAPWPYRRELAISNSLITANLTNFPVLVKLTNTTFTFSHALTNGYDIRFTASDGQTLLAFERERHTSAGAEYWVRIPLIASASNTPFYIYYGNTNAPDATSASNVWDSHFSMVHHLAQNTSPVRDSTSNANHGVSNRVALGQAGIVGNGIYLSATGAFIECGTAAMPNAQDAQTLEAWALYTSKPTSPNNQNLVLTANDSAGVQLGFRGGNTTAWLFGAVLCATNAAPPTNQWNHFVFVTEGTSNSHALYINGVRYAGLTQALQTGTPNQVRISTSSWGEYFLGRIDEVRISRGARSAAWITADYQSTRNALLKYGTEETRPAVLIGKGRDAWQLESDPARHLYFWVDESSLTYPKPLATNWQHMVFTCNSSTRNIYLNGQLATGAVFTGSISANSSNVLIGAHFPGHIGEVRLYNRVLSTNEIYGLFNGWAYTTTNYPGCVLLCQTNPFDLHTATGSRETWCSPVSMPPVRNALRLDFDTSLYIPFDHGPGAIDHSRYAHPVTEQGVWLAPGRHRLNGAGESLTIADDASLDGTPSMSFSVWFIPHVIPASGVAGIIRKQGAYSLALDPSGHAAFEIGTGDSVFTDTVLETNRLYHITAVFDGSLSEAQRMRLFLDGKLERAGFSTNMVIPRQPSSSLYIGATGTSASVTLNATLGPILLLRRAPGPAEISVLDITARKYLNQMAP